MPRTLKVPELDALYAAASPALREWIDAGRPHIIALTLASHHKGVTPLHLSLLAQAVSAGATLSILKRLAAATLISAKPTILLPAGRYYLTSRERSWCRSGSGADARWGIKTPKGQFEVDAGRWLIHSDDGFTRSQRVSWTVENVKVGENVWTLAK